MLFNMKYFIQNSECFCFFSIPIYQGENALQGHNFKAEKGVFQDQMNITLS